LKHDEIFAPFVFASFVIFVVHSFSYTTPIRPALVLARVPEREDHERRERNEMLTGLRDLNVAKTSKEVPAKVARQGPHSRRRGSVRQT